MDERPRTAAIYIRRVKLDVAIRIRRGPFVSASRELVLDLRRAPLLARELQGRSGFDRAIAAISVLSAVPSVALEELYFTDLNRAYEECTNFLRDAGVDIDLEATQ